MWSGGGRGLNVHDFVTGKDWAGSRRPVQRPVDSMAFGQLEMKISKSIRVCTMRKRLCPLPYAN